MIWQADVMDNPNAMAKAGEVWTQIESSRQEYESLVEMAFHTMGGHEGLAEECGEWLDGIESKLYASTVRLLKKH
jgi:hypothetical protein